MGVLKPLFPLGLFLIFIMMAFGSCTGWEQPIAVRFDSPRHWAVGPVTFARKPF